MEQLASGSTIAALLAIIACKMRILTADEGKIAIAKGSGGHHQHSQGGKAQFYSSSTDLSLIEPLYSALGTV
jgi:hypothetical protein